MMARKLLLVTTLLTCAACSPYRHERPATGVGTDAVITPERTRRGNPPFYEVMGQRYFVATTSEGYRERGVASWYGKKFHGLPTASGEIYDMHELTAAHKTLPIPTWVEVTNLSNASSIIVKVNDRGPFVDNRIIDLSYASAQKLGMVEAGTSLVEVRALGAPASGRDQTTARAADSASTSAITPAGYATTTPVNEPLYLQVGAFGDQANAQRLLERLTNEGVDNAFMTSVTNKDPAIHRVRIGPIQTVASFDALVGRLASLGFGDARLVTLD
jgi:rare lipoprotein A